MVTDIPAGRLGRIPGLVLAVVLLSWGCQPAVPEITTAEKDQVTQVAEPVASELLRTLVGRLTLAMEEGGPVGAIEFCSHEAIPLTHSVQSGFSEVVQLKRASFRYRNPQNVPDEAEEQALRYFEDAILSGKPVSAGYVQKVSDAEFRYYKPLYLGEVCLQCHGDREAMSPEVRSSLEERYPADLATGYAAGDFRGVVRVSVPTAPLNPGTGQ